MLCWKKLGWTNIFLALHMHNFNEGLVVILPILWLKETKVQIERNLQQHAIGKK